MLNKILRHDKVGEWTETKLDVIRQYLDFWATVMGAPRQACFTRIYIDGFAGSGMNISRKTGETIFGSAALALQTDPPFHEYYFIEKRNDKCKLLEALAKEHQDKSISIVRGDSSEVLVQQLILYIAGDRFKRAVLLLDPHGLQFSWNVIELAGKSKSVDLILNFSNMGTVRNALVSSPAKLDAKKIGCMNRVCGDTTWFNACFRPPESDLFSTDPDFAPHPRKQHYRRFAEWYKQRMIEVAGFKYASASLDLRQSTNATLFFLFLASQKEVAKKVMNYIVKKYQHTRV